MATIRTPFTKEYTYLPSLELEFRGTFIGKTFYWVMREWFMEHGYTDITNGNDLLMVERIYFEVKGHDRQVRARWRTMKNAFASGFGTGFLKWFIDVDIRIHQMTEVEIMSEGRKVKGLTGTVRMEFRGRLETEADYSFKKHWLLRNINDFFQKRIYKQELENNRKELYRDLYRFHGMIKKFFDLQIFIPEFEVFHKRHEIA